MKSYGTTGAAVTCDRGVPIPTRPRGDDADHILERIARRDTRVSPIVLHNPGEFTADQLRAAGFAVVGDKSKPTRRTRINGGGPRGAAIPTADGARIVKLYRDGMKVGEVASECGVSTATVRRYLDAADVVRRDDRVRRAPHADIAVDVDIVRELYTVEGLFQAQIAARLGVPLRTIERTMAGAGLTAADRASIPRPNPVATLMAANHITAADVRQWANRNGHPCEPRGYPPKHLVEAYLLTRVLSTTHTQKGTA